MSPAQVLLAVLTAVAICQANYILVGVWTFLFIVTLVTDYQLNKGRKK